MAIPFSEPDPAGCERARLSKKLRNLATDIARLRPQALTQTNREEADHGPRYPANFTKGLKHDSHGLLEDPADYHCFVEAINSPDRTLFEKHVRSARDHVADAEDLFHCDYKTTCHNAREKVEWRGWESPRAGHVYELQGADAGAGTDFQAVRDGFVAVTPLKVDLTRDEAVEGLRGWVGATGAEWGSAKGL